MASKQKTIIVCSLCGRKVEKPLQQYNRNVRLNRHQFCSRSCRSKVVSGKIDVGSVSYTKERISNLKALSPFKWHFRNVKHHCKKNNLECDISPEFLEELWNSQNGICPYTGWKLRNDIRNRKYYKEKNGKIYNIASLDRIDSSLGYTKDNVHFIALIANFGKNNFSENEFFELCKSVTEHRNLRA